MFGRMRPTRARRGSDDSSWRKQPAWERVLRRLGSDLERRRATRRVLLAARSVLRTRPRLGLAVILCIAVLSFCFSGYMFASAVRSYCRCNGNSVLCPYLVKRAEDGCVLAMPDVESEADAVNDDGEGMLAYVGKDVAMEYGGVGWQMAQATPPPATRVEARIAYFIQIGQDSIDLLPRLFQRLHHPDNVYILHVDAKVEAEDKEGVYKLVNSNALFKNNMHFLPSEMLTYKGFSMVLNTLSAMTLACRVDQTWDYFINLSGADYPLLSPKAQRRLLARPAVPSERLNFVSFFPTKEWKPYQFRVKFQYWDPALLGRQDPASKLRRKKSQRVYPLEAYRRYTFAKAEAWMILSRSFCKFVVRSTYAKKMLLSHMHVLSAPEHYFADVLYNHPVWRKTIVPDAFRKVVWYHHRRRSGQHPYVLDDPDNGPLEFWLYLKETRSLFARKFGNPNSDLMDKVDYELSGARVPENTADAGKYVKYNRWFFANLASHFDYLTKATLQGQAVEVPVHAYPKLS